MTPIHSLSFGAFFVGQVKKRSCQLAISETAVYLKKTLDVVIGNACQDTLKQTTEISSKVEIFSIFLINQ